MELSAKAISRRALLAGLGLGGVVLVSACGSSAPAATPAGAAAPTQPAASTAPAAKPSAAIQAAPASAAATPAAASQPAASAGTPVTFWIPWGQPERQKWAQKWGAAFHDKNPSQGFKMEFVGFGNMRQRWIAAHQAKQMPEVLDTTFDELGTAFVAGATEAIDDVVKDLGGTSFFIDSPLASWQYQGKHFGFPQYVFPRMLYYRKDLLQAKGLKEPTSWEEWLSSVVALTDAKNNQWGVTFSVNGHSPEPIAYLMRGQGSAMFDKDGKPLLDTDAGYAAIDLYAKLVKQGGPPGMTNYTEDDQDKLFLSRDVGFDLTWPSLLGFMVKQLPTHV
ncbi:MAG TPA: extracellular solute-binding protein, partial [Chloroflexota bacterium]|nr:extracellular solute-binding protein [Chloroflexota bacterium]